MPRSRQDLAFEVLGLLGVFNVGQDPSEDDRKQVNDAIDGKFDELARRKVYYVQDAERIDDAVFQPLSKIVANAVAPKFGMPFDAGADAREEARLKDIDRRPPSYDTMVGPYF